MSTGSPKCHSVLIFHLNLQVSLFLGIYHEVGWSKCSRELIRLASALGRWWMRVAGQISPLPCWGNSESYSTLSPKGPHWDWAPVAHSSNLLDTATLLAAFSLPSHFPTPPVLFSRITSQINYLTSNPRLRVNFWGNPNQDTGILGFFRMVKLLSQKGGRLRWYWVQGSAGLNLAWRNPCPRLGTPDLLGQHRMIILYQRREGYLRGLPVSQPWWINWPNLSCMVMAATFNRQPKKNVETSI